MLTRNLTKFYIKHRVIICNSQSKTIDPPVILQVSGKYFPKTSGVP